MTDQQWPALGFLDSHAAVAIARAMFEYALDPIMLTVPTDGRILDANAAACSVLGRSVEEIRNLGREGLRDPTDDTWDPALAERARTGRFAGEVRMLRADGTPFPAEISSAVFDADGTTYAVLIFRDVSGRRQLEGELRAALDEASRLATVDDLTGLLNRRGFMTIGQQLVERAHRRGHSLYLIAADLDGLKQINDQHGHAAGDAALREVAHALTTTLRRADVVARLGGDEFAVILTDASDPTEVTAALDRLREHLRESSETADRPWHVSLSVGVATIADSADLESAHLESLMREADAALYRAKEQRR